MHHQLISYVQIEHLKGQLAIELRRHNGRSSSLTRTGTARTGRSSGFGASLASRADDEIASIRALLDSSLTRISRDASPSKLDVELRSLSRSSRSRPSSPLRASYRRSQSPPVRLRSSFEN